MNVRVSVVAVALLLMSTAVHAQEQSTEKSSAACGEAFDQCLAQCDVDHPDDPAGKAACVPTCSGKYAACDAGVAYEKAKPWIEEQAGKTKKFFEDLLEDLKREDAPTDGQTRENSI